MMLLIKLGVIFKGIIRESMGILEHLSFVLPIKITKKNIISNIKTIIIIFYYFKVNERITC